MPIKLFVLDTSVLLHDPDAIFRFTENEVHIPAIVFWELDKKKTAEGVIGYNSRRIARTLNELLEKESPGVTTLKINNNLGKLVFGLEEKPGHSPDQQIIQYAKDLSATQSHSVIVVSKDIYLRNSCMLQGVQAENYKYACVEQLYHGLRQVMCEPGEIDALYITEPINKMGDKIRPGLKLVSLADSTAEQLKDLQPNECITLVDSTNLSRHGLTRYNSKSKSLQVISSHNRDFTVCGIKPLNCEQKYALDLLLDPEVEFLSIIGATGSGKTLLALASALHQTMYLNLYEKIIVTRKQVSVGAEDIGFLPGKVCEKTKPWMEAIYGCLSKIAKLDKGLKNDRMLGRSYEAYTGNEEEENGILQVKSLGFVRGVTWENSILIVDEVQNMHINEVKALTTRAGKGSKVIIMGDIAQIDLEVSRYLDERSNGLTVASKKMRGWSKTGHITLFKTERSELSSEAAKRL
jgi:PhoH-like ATPase